MSSPPCHAFSGAFRGCEGGLEGRCLKAEAALQPLEGAAEARWAAPRLRPRVVVVENSPRILDKKGFAVSHGYQERIFGALSRAVDAAVRSGAREARWEAARLDPGRMAPRCRAWLVALLAPAVGASVEP